MTYRVRIAPAGNTYNPCLQILKNKGYHLWAEETSEQVLWNAEKDDTAYMGYSPPELLGIVVLGETFGADWNRQEPDLLDEITERMSDKESP